MIASGSPAKVSPAKASSERVSPERALPEQCWFLFDNGAKAAPDIARKNTPAILLKHPVAVIRADHAADIPAAFDRLQQAVDDGYVLGGFFSYELGYALEPRLLPLLPPVRRLPLLWFGAFHHPQAADADSLTQFLHESGQRSAKTKGDANDYRQALTSEPQPQLSRTAYARLFKRAKQLISAGDLYQLNLTFPLRFACKCAPEQLYLSLRSRQPVSYGGMLSTPDFAILSLSPELFFRIENGHIHTRPMKGTMKRGVSPAHDALLRKALAGDEKNRAENLMIVDLMRNDFARICEPGGVGVSDLYRIETYPTLLQMTSGVSGRLRRNVGIAELAQALFPAGSITGAPKLRAMQAIRELESAPRGAYCGAMGVMRREKGGRGDGGLSALFNVAIRTLTLYPDGEGEAAVGSGVVADSGAEDEYEECLLKYRFMTDAPARDNQTESE